MAAAIAPLSAAQADVMSDVGGHLNSVSRTVSGTLDRNIGAVWHFLSSSAPETGRAAPLPAPVEVTPAVRLERSLEALPTDAPRLAVADFTPPEAPLARELPKPTWERASKFLYCVEYARQLSGLSIFGDAKHWWERAKNLYARVAHPAEEAVMVFSGTKRLKRGHLAVVSHVVSNREIRVEQANWLNRGEIDRATPVLDVSEKNDWSKVRVWDVPSGQFGSRVYAISGFILKPAQRLARND